MGLSPSGVHRHRPWMGIFPSDTSNVHPYPTRSLCRYQPPSPAPPPTHTHPISLQITTPMSALPPTPTHPIPECAYITKCSASSLSLTFHPNLLTHRRPYLPPVNADATIINVQVTLSVSFQLTSDSRFAGCSNSSEAASLLQVWGGERAVRSGRRGGGGRSSRRGGGKGL